MKQTHDESKTNYHLIANSFIKLPEPTDSCSAHAHIITMSLSCHLNLMNKLEYELIDIKHRLGLKAAKVY